MQLLVLTATLLVLTVIGFYLGRTRAVAASSGRVRDLHSLPSYYGYYVALWCGIPALLVLALWFVGEQRIVDGAASLSVLPEYVRSLPTDRLGLVLNDVKNLASGNVLSSDADPGIAAGGRLLHPSRSHQPLGDDRSRARHGDRRLSLRARSGRS